MERLSVRLSTFLIMMINRPRMKQLVTVYFCVISFLLLCACQPNSQHEAEAQEQDLYHQLAVLNDWLQKGDQQKLLDWWNSHPERHENMLRILLAHHLFARFHMYEPIMPELLSTLSKTRDYPNFQPYLTWVQAPDFFSYIQEPFLVPQLLPRKASSSVPSNFFSAMVYGFLEDLKPRKQKRREHNQRQWEMLVHDMYRHTHPRSDIDKCQGAPAVYDNISFSDWQPPNGVQPTGEWENGILPYILMYTRAGLSDELLADVLRHADTLGDEGLQAWARYFSMIAEPDKHDAALLHLFKQAEQRGWWLLAYKILKRRGYHDVYDDMNLFWPKIQQPYHRALIQKLWADRLWMKHECESAKSLYAQVLRYESPYIRLDIIQGLQQAQAWPFLYEQRTRLKNLSPVVLQQLLES